MDVWDWEGRTAYAKYSNFIVGGAMSNYTLQSVGNYSGTAGMRMIVSLAIQTL